MTELFKVRQINLSRIRAYIKIDKNRSKLGAGMQKINKLLESCLAPVILVPVEDPL